LSVLIVWVSDDTQSPAISQLCTPAGLSTLFSLLSATLVTAGFLIFENLK